jgi:hypothetical protein
MGTVEKETVIDLIFDGMLNTSYMKDSMLRVQLTRQIRRPRFAVLTPQPRFLNVLPKKGDWCITAPDSRSKPVVCFDTYQEAREYSVLNEVPQTQGLNVRGTERWVECVREEYMQGGAAGSGRDIIRIRACVNLTGKPRQHENAESLSGYRRR